MLLALTLVRIIYSVRSKCIQVVWFIVYLVADDLAVPRVDCRGEGRACLGSAAHKSELQTPDTLHIVLPTQNNNGS